MHPGSRRRRVGDVEIADQGPVEAGKKYLDDLRVPIGNLRNIPFNTIGVNGTPTLLLVNNEGKVTASWKGKLPSEKESEVLNSFRQDLPK